MGFDSTKSDEIANSSKKTREVTVANGEIDSQELFQTERELKIRHGDDTYRLRLTGLNKLILTK
jgi:hemin uptake protein HemP